MKPSDAAKASGAEPVLMQAMSGELDRAMRELGHSQQATVGAKGLNPAEPTIGPYYLSYSVSDTYQLRMTARQGALMLSNDSHERIADIQLRVGDAKLDNTHGTHHASALNSAQLPLADDRPAIERALWLATNRGYGNALQTFAQVKTETQVRAKEEDLSADFSKQKPETSIGVPAAAPAIDLQQWQDRLRSLSGIFREYPEVYNNFVALQAEADTSYFVSSEGSKVVAPHRLTRLIVLATSRAEDGMDLFRVETFEAETPAGLPDMQTIEAKVRVLAKDLQGLKKAPVTEPYNGPAILSGRAAAVFFHEVLGHRLEGQRQRGEEEGQTFTKDIGKPILPAFLSVEDDPTLETFHGIELSGHYTFDDEGQRARRVDLIDDGVLKTFLMSRLPIASFDSSNGHGRAQTGRMPTGRQGNLIVTSKKSVPDGELRTMLVDEAKKQGKPYGLFFADISSGFAVTTRRSPQAFSVLPILVYRVYVDGRPDELVRGVSIVGTPQAALNRIQATSDRQDVFNGECGAESGSIPVSAVAPAMLVTEIETQRVPKGTNKVPILPPPTAEDKGTGGAQ